MRNLCGFALASCLQLAACGDGGGTSVELPAEGPVAAVRLSPDTLRMEVGIPHQAHATPVNAEGVPLAGRKITWSVSDTAVASVTPEGMVTSRAVGSTTLTATAEVVSGTARIVVLTSASLPPSECALVGNGPESHRLRANTQPSTGELKVVMLFVDFPDAPASESTSELYELLVPVARAWFSELSQGRFSLSVDAVDEWFHAPETSDTYDWKGFRGHRDYISQVTALADPGVDFSPYSAVFIVASRGADRRNSSAFHAFPGDGIMRDGVEIRSAVTFGQDSRSQLTRHHSAFLTVHETAHLLGLPDLYLVDATSWQASHAAVGMWDPMSYNGLGTHFITWHKWKLGWLDDHRVDCVGRASVERTLVPFGAADGLQALVIPTHSWRVLVVEVRRARGFDSRICEEGVLIYAVDVDVPTKYGPVRVQSARPDGDRVLSRGEFCGPLYESSYGRGGDRISLFSDGTLSGVTVKVIEDLGDGYRVRVNRN